ncbi:hypothetical protein [Vibrio harveyi]|nr:hypothetical protein [Vibrio harveyi]WJT09230.1 hypothetical protein PH545_24705 [Vibrio harveyi]
MERARQELEVIATLMESEQPISEGVKEWIIKAVTRSQEVIRQQEEDK